MKDEPSKVELDMTKEEVEAILGAPDEIEEDKQSFAIVYHYEEYEPYRKREIRFVDGKVASVSVYGVDKVDT